MFEWALLIGNVCLCWVAYIRQSVMVQVAFFVAGKYQGGDVLATRKEITESLLGQLRDRGLMDEHYRDLVADYVKYWAIARKLQTDINKRGCKVEKRDSRGQLQTVNNESIDQLLKVHSSMLRILEALGLSAPKGGGFGMDDEPL